MGSLEHLIERVCRAAVWVGGSMLLVCAVMVTVEVILRKVFVVSVGGANEFSGYALAISASWAFAYTLLHRGHIRIDAVHRQLPRRVRASLDVLAIACLAIFMAVLSRHAVVVLLNSIKLGATSNTPISTPLWIPQLLWLVGLVVFWLVSLYLLFCVVRAYFKGDLDRVNRLAGIGGVQEELDEELSQAGARGGSGKD